MFSPRTSRAGRDDCFTSVAHRQTVEKVFGKIFRIPSDDENSEFYRDIVRGRRAHGFNFSDGSRRSVSTRVGPRTGVSAVTSYFSRNGTRTRAVETVAIETADFAVYGDNGSSVVVGFGVRSNETRVSLRQIARPISNVYNTAGPVSSRVNNTARAPPTEQYYLSLTYVPRSWMFLVFFFFFCSYCQRVRLTRRLPCN